MFCHPISRIGLYESFSVTNLMGKPPLGQKVQPNPSKPRKGMRKVSAKKAAYRSSSEGKAAAEYIGLVKQLPCAVCGAAGPSDAHHPIMDRFSTARVSDFDVIPLCINHHRYPYPHAIHSGKEVWRERYGNDYDYIEQTRKLVGDLFD